jgi:hypothetical protein
MTKLLSVPEPLIVRDNHSFPVSDARRQEAT